MQIPLPTLGIQPESEPPPLPTEKQMKPWNASQLFQIGLHKLHPKEPLPFPEHQSQSIHHYFSSKTITTVT